MTRILVLYATYDGQTERIARRIADGLARPGTEVAVESAQSPRAASAIACCDAVVVGGAIRYGRFPPFLVDLVQEEAPAIAARPNAFFSVSLSAIKDTADAKRCMLDLGQRTGWHPEASAAFAGALRYSAYTPFVRFMMRLIAYANHGGTDTTRDYEYTDWAAVDGFAAQFAAKVAAYATATA